MERTFNGAATEEELGGVIKCGKSRVPSAGVSWESARTTVTRTLAAVGRPDLVNSTLPLAECAALNQYLNSLSM